MSNSRNRINRGAKRLEKNSKIFSKYLPKKSHALACALKPTSVPNDHLTLLNNLNYFSAIEALTRGLKTGTISPSKF
jgi:hypothetical protein